jgi:hypothetical protein
MRETTEFQPDPKAVVSGDTLSPNCRIIAVHLRDLRQLFDSLDPSPFHEKDLDKDAEEYIVGSALEFSWHDTLALVVHLEHEAEIQDQGKVIGDAIRTHFERLTLQANRELSQFLRRGRLSLVIGLVFLGIAMAGGAYVKGLLGDRTLTTLIQEGLIIGGWVAMWRPMEIFLYDWWPIRSKRNLFARISKMSVQIIYESPRP